MTLKFATRKKKALPSSLPDLPMPAVKWTPEPYQLRAVKWLLSNAGAALLLDPGLGKTSITLAAVKVMLRSGVASRVLVVAPLRVCTLVWPAELEKWLDFEGISHVVLHGHKKAALLRSQVDVFIINPEGLGWLLTKPNMKLLDADTLVVDESTKFKSSKSQRFKSIKKWLHTFSRRWILTGTATPNGLIDLFGQLYIVDMGRSLGCYITQYRDKYFEPSGWGGYTYVLRDGADKEIYKAIKPYALRLDEKDYLTLPDTIVNDIVVELPDKARKLYDEMEADYLIELDGQEITAVSAGVAGMKCRQLAGGAIYNNNNLAGNGMLLGEKYTAVHDAKLSALVDLIEQRQGKPTMVMVQFKHDIDRIQVELGTRARPLPVIGKSLKSDKAICDDWNAGKLPIVIGHPGSMAHGLNLQFGGDAIVWFNVTWNYEEYDQTIRRLRRRGSVHKKIFVYRIIAKNTVDEIILAVLRSKHHVQKDFHDAMNTYRARRFK